MEKKLYFELSDGGDVSRVVMELSGAFEWIKNDELEEGTEVEYTLTPVWYTDEEFANLPEASV